MIPKELGIGNMELGLKEFPKIVSQELLRAREIKRCEGKYCSAGGTGIFIYLLGVQRSRLVVQNVEIPRCLKCAKRLSKQKGLRIPRGERLDQRCSSGLRDPTFGAESAPGAYGGG